MHLSIVDDCTALFKLAGKGEIDLNVFHFAEALNYITLVLKTHVGIRISSSLTSYGFSRAPMGSTICG